MQSFGDPSICPVSGLDWPRDQQVLMPEGQQQESAFLEDPQRGEAADVRLKRAEARPRVLAPVCVHAVRVAMKRRQ